MNRHVDAIPLADALAGETSRPPAFSDEALALLFADRHALDLRFVSAWGKWLSWTGTHWALDDTLHAFDLARRICRDVAAGCNKVKIASAIASAKTVAAVERLAKADRRMAATIDQWDADPWALNTPDGVVDLKTGMLRRHRPGDYMTKITSTGPRGDCPRFLQFLDTIAAGDVELIAYLRRTLGYALTGDTREHALFLVTAPARTAKAFSFRRSREFSADTTGPPRSRFSPRALGIVTRLIWPAYAARGSLRPSRPKRADVGRNRASNH